MWALEIEVTQGDGGRMPAGGYVHVALAFLLSLGNSLKSPRHAHLAAAAAAAASPSGAGGSGDTVQRSRGSRA